MASFVDGVYRSRSGTAVAELLDVDRIEVLKGPQGTLFGKNATAGVLHIINNRPNPETTEFSAEFSVEEYSTYRGQMLLNTPLGDAAAFRIVGQVTTGDGWIDNEGPFSDVNDRERQTVRAQLGFQPSDNWDANLSFDYSGMDESCCSTVRIADGPFTGPLRFLAMAQDSTVISPPDPEALRTAIDYENTTDTDDYGFGLELNWDLLESLRLTSVTAYRDYNTETRADGDFTGADILHINEDIGLSNFSQELRLSGSSPGTVPIDWTLGFYYADEEINRTRIFDWRPQVAVYFPPFLAPRPGIGVIDELGQDATTTSVFAHTTMRLSERFALTVGVRYNWEDKDGSGAFEQPNNIVLTFVNPSFAADVDEQEPIYTVSGQFDFTAQLTGYATYSTGYKAGGINLAREASGVAANPFNPSPPPPEPTFKQETADHYEFGFKGEFDRARFSIAYFNTQYDDVQSQIFSPPLFLVRNGESAETRGVEAELLWVPAEGFRVNAGLLFLDTEFGDGTDLGSGPVGGEDLPWAPEFSASLGFDWQVQLAGGWSLDVGAGLLHRGEHGVNADPNAGFEEESTTLLHGQIKLLAPSERWSIAVWCSNCGDQYYSEVIFTSPVDFFPGMGAAVEAYPGRPREIGVTLGYKL